MPNSLWIMCVKGSVCDTSQSPLVARQLAESKLPRPGRTGGFGLFVGTTAGS